MKPDEPLSVAHSEARIDRPAAESWVQPDVWFRGDFTNKLVAAYQIGRLLNCRNWLRARRLFPERYADARQQLAQVDAKLIRLEGVVKEAGQTSVATQAIRQSSVCFESLRTSKRYHDWWTRFVEMDKSWHDGTKIFKPNKMFDPDKPVENALTRGLVQAHMTSIGLGRVVDEGNRPVRNMSLGDFDLMKEEEPHARGSEIDLVWLAYVRAYCRWLSRRDPRLGKVLDNLEQRAGVTKQSDAVRALDTHIVEAMWSFVPTDEQGTDPPPGYLGLNVEFEKKVIRRAGFKAEVNLARSAIAWHLFSTAFEAEGKNARERLHQNYPGEVTAIRSAINTLNKALKPLKVHVEGHRLIARNDATDG
jgi:hypothetical protein